MKRVILMTVIALLAFAANALCAQFIKQDDFNRWSDEKRNMIIVDIQPKDEYEKHHFKESYETNAFPAKTDEEKKRLDAVLPNIQSSKVPVVIVCPRGKSGAMNTNDYFKSKGVAEDRLYILEGGVAGCPYRDKLEKGR